MIIREFIINESNIKYFVGINQIEIDSALFLNNVKVNSKKELLESFLKIVDDVQNQFENCILQFMKDKYILNQDHIFTACYHLQKAFHNNSNISNKKKIELLLYLSTNRQINRSINTFGIESSDILTGRLLYCMISPTNNLNNINDELLKILNADTSNLTLNNQSNEKFKLIKEFYEISEEQINCILNSYGIDDISIKNNLYSKFLALYDLICEKMVYLTLEKIKK